MIRCIQTEECRLNQKKENGLRKNFNKKFGLFKDNSKSGGKTLLVRASPVGHSPTTLHTHEVTGSSPVVSTKTLESSDLSRVFSCFPTLIQTACLFADFDDRNEV